MSAEYDVDDAWDYFCDRLEDVRRKHNLTDDQMTELINRRLGMDAAEGWAQWMSEDDTR